MTLGKNIQELRNNKGYSQEYVATQMNVSRQAVSKWERDETLPDLYNLKKLASIFQISMDELLDQKITPSIEMSLMNKIAFSFLFVPTLILLISSIWIIVLVVSDVIGGLS
jgi:transcriptional regulator with XRE-family HTH domain